MVADLMTGSKSVVNPSEFRLPRFDDDSWTRSHPGV